MTFDLIGHGEAVSAFTAAARGERLHHAWLLAGPQGLGKARFAELAALWLLAEAAGPIGRQAGMEVAPDHRIAALFAAGSHPDYRILRRLPRDRSEELARNITVDQVRGLQPLFGTTPSLSSRRVVVIDAMDELERSAANALLKNLEEPPAGTLFLLVTHAPGRLLATIRSRCRVLRFNPLADAEVAAILARQGLADDGTVARAAGGLPGAAMRFAGLGLDALDRALDALATLGDPGNALRSTLARDLATKAAQGRYAAFLERAPARIAAAARQTPVAKLPPVLDLWTQAREVADRAVRLSDDPALTVFALAGLVARLAPEGAAAKA